jgi:hypothetical protein
MNKIAKALFLADRVGPHFCAMLRRALGAILGIAPSEADEVRAEVNERICAVLDEALEHDDREMIALCCHALSRSSQSESARERVLRHLAREAN